jgi:transcriptional repressor NrdR
MARGKMTSENYGRAIPCKCGGKTQVLDSRPVKVDGTNSIRRRRCCINCGARFTTYEIMEERVRILEDAETTRKFIRSVIARLQELAK